MSNIVNLYDPFTLLFVGTDMDQPDPEVPGEFIIPIHSTAKPLPALSQNQAAQFDEALGDWVVIPDFRGKTFYDKTTGAAVVIEVVGAVPVNLAATKPVSILRGEVWEKIKSKRITIMAGGVQVGASWFHSDETSRIQQLGLKDEARDMLAAGAQAADQLVIDGSPVIWKTMSGSFVPMTVQLALDIVAAVKVLDKRAHTAAEGHRIAMEAAADPAAYNYSAGWPATFPLP